MQTWHFVALAALTLTGCALPDASGMGSFMTAMHPTQDFCASRGLRLDATTKQCAPPPQPTEITGSLPPSQSDKRQPVAVQVLPPAMPAPRPPEVHQRVASVPIESGAVISSKLQQDPDLVSDLAHFVRASGHRCDTISELQEDSDAPRFKLACDRSAHKYTIEEKDGRWNVTLAQ